MQSIETKSENGLHELCAVSNASPTKDASADDWVQRLTAVQEILQVCARAKREEDTMLLLL